MTLRRRRRQGGTFIRAPRRTRASLSRFGSSSPDPERRLRLCPLASVQARRHQARDLPQLDAPGSLALPHCPRHEPVARGAPSHRLRGRRAQASARGERLVSLLRGAESRDAALVGLAVQDPPAGAALRRGVRGGAVVSAPARGAARGRRGFPPVRAGASGRRCGGCPLGGPARPREAAAPRPRRADRAARRDLRAPVRARRRDLGSTTRRENRVALPLPSFAYDDEARTILRARYAEDFDTTATTRRPPRRTRTQSGNGARRSLRSCPSCETPFKSTTGSVSFTAWRAGSSTSSGRSSGPSRGNAGTQKRRCSRTSRTTRASTSSGDGRRGRRRRGSPRSSAPRTRPTLSRGSCRLFSAPWSGSSSSTTARRTAHPRSPGAWPRSAAPPTGSRSTPIPSR